MKEEREVYMCDECNKELIVKKQLYVGGHPSSGWVHVHRANYSTNLTALQAKKNFDFCCIDCMKKYTF